MITEIVYLVIGVVAVIILTCLNRGLTKPDKNKRIVFSFLTVLVTTVLMIVSSEYVPIIDGESEEVLWGCIGVVVIPLVLSFGSILLLIKLSGRKQKGLIISAIFAAVCCALGCLFESKFLIELQEYISQMDFDSNSLWTAFSFEPKYVYLVKALILLPSVFELLVSCIFEKTKGKRQGIL